MYIQTDTGSDVYFYFSQKHANLIKKESKKK